MGLYYSVHALHIYFHALGKFDRHSGNAKLDDFAVQVIAAIPTAETAGNIANILFSLTLLFCGVIATPATFPGFWYAVNGIRPDLGRFGVRRLNVFSGSSCTALAPSRSEFRLRSLTA